MSGTHHRSGIALVVVLCLTSAAHGHEPDPHDAPKPPEPDEHKTLVRKAPIVRVGGARRIGGAPLELLPLKTPEDALRLVPGLVLVQHGNEGKGHQIYVRGFDAVHGSDFAISLDGVMLNELSNVHASGYLDLSGIPTDLIASVDATKGPFALEQGLFATAGSARYTLGVPADRRGLRLGYEVGTTNRHRLFATWAPEAARDRSFGGVELVHDDGFGASREVDRVSLAVRSGALAEGADTIDLTIIGGLARFELPGTLAQGDIDSGFVDFLGAYDDRSYGQSDRLIGIVRHVHETSALRVATAFHVGARRLELAENFTGDLGRPDVGDRRWQRERRLHSGVDSSLGLALDARWQLDAVVGARVDELVQTEDDVGWDGAIIARQRALDATQTSAHAALAATLRADELTARAALRVELLGLAAHDRLTRERGDELLAALLPRLELGWRPSRTFALSAAYGRGVRPPEARAVVRMDAPPDTILDAYRGGEPAFTAVDALELGAHVHFNDRLRVTLVGFASLVARESVFDHVSGQNLDLDGSRRLGVELTLEAEPIDDLGLRVDATFADARYDRSGNQVAGVPPLLVAAEVFTTPLEHLRLGARALVLGERPLAHGATGAGYVNVGLGADFTVGAFRFGLTIDNLLARDIPEGVYHFASHWDPDAPRSLLPRLQTVAGTPFTARLKLEVDL